MAKDDGIEAATGATLEQWARRLEEAGLGGAGHAEIAAWFEDQGGLSPWWSQQAAVLYERAYRGRPLGMTADGTFQMGASRTFPCSAQRLWEVLESERSLGLIREPSSVPLRYTVRTEGSHFRIRWRGEGWPRDSTLQVRVVPKGPASSTLTFHHEGLPDAGARAAMLARWKAALDEIGAMIDTEGLVP